MSGRQYNASGRRRVCAAGPGRSETLLRHADANPVQVGWIAGVRGANRSGWTARQIRPPTGPWRQRLWEQLALALDTTWRIARQARVDARAHRVGWTPEPRIERGRVAPEHGRVRAAGPAPAAVGAGLDAIGISAAAIRRWNRARTAEAATRIDRIAGGTLGRALHGHAHEHARAAVAAVRLHVVGADRLWARDAGAGLDGRIGHADRECGALAASCSCQHAIGRDAAAATSRPDSPVVATDVVTGRRRQLVGRAETPREEGHQQSADQATHERRGAKHELCLSVTGQNQVLYPQFFETIRPIP
ncbi:MAG: hypothetical protein H6Q90_6136 [Deltaproteobacteria bacterium]|nr:hypothetical protein [Deltaproteobacteria bacterium]